MRDKYKSNAFNTQEYNSDQKTIQSCYIMSQNKKKQKNIKKEQLLNKRDIIEHKFMQNQFRSNNIRN